MLNRPTTDERLGRDNSRGLVRYFLLLMALVYTGLGIYLLVAAPQAFPMPILWRRLLGAVFVFYGILRFVRVYRQHFRFTNEN